jgi:hypothetical protein
MDEGNAIVNHLLPYDHGGGRATAFNALNEETAAEAQPLIGLCAPLKVEIYGPVMWGKQVLAAEHCHLQAYAN